MLQTEDIDDDYFTPASSTSLANIFGKSQNEDSTENESLKYTPPKSSQLTAKSEEQKATCCIFACTLLGYEWFNRAYITRGKLGFAILNVLKTGEHNIILYDSKKVTLSSAALSMNFEVTLKENTYFSYLDNQQKYWSLYATEDEMCKIITLLKTLNVKIKYSTEEEKKPAVLGSSQELTALKKGDIDIVKRESDTDSSLNEKTKMSLINRMANMGQSVLPPRVMSAEKSSDSSDTNETSHYKIRHKPIRNSIKRNGSEKSVAECQTLVEAQKIVPRKELSSESLPLYTYVNSQLVPVTNTNIITSSSISSANDMNYFISEQRMNNSELRINMNRISDKLDQVLGTVSKKDAENKDSSSNFQVNMLQKLLTEYENKIKIYEQFIKKSDQSINITQLFENTILQGQDEELHLLKEKNHKLEQLCCEKDAKISRLESEMECLKAKYDESIAKDRLCINRLSENVQSLNHKIAVKNEEFSVLMNKFEELVKHSKTEDEIDLGTKIKNVMNDTFRAISANFENAESYSGERVKSVTATVIKRVTIESLGSI